MIVDKTKKFHIMIVILTDSLFLAKFETSKRPQILVKAFQLPRRKVVISTQESNTTTYYIHHSSLHVEKGRPFIIDTLYVDLENGHDLQTSTACAILWARQDELAFFGNDVKMKHDELLRTREMSQQWSTCVCSNILQCYES